MSYFATAAEEAASAAEEAAAVASAAADEAAAAASEAAAAASEAADEAWSEAVAAEFGFWQATTDMAATAAPATRILRRTSEVMVLVPFGG
jgi:colicin import membrane protein